MNETDTTTRKSLGWYLLVAGVFLGGIGLFILSLVSIYLAIGLGPEFIDAIYTAAEAIAGIDR